MKNLAKINIALLYVSSFREKKHFNFLIKQYRLNQSELLVKLVGFSNKSWFQVMYFVKATVVILQ